MGKGAHNEIENIMLNKLESFVVFGCWFLVVGVFLFRDCLFIFLLCYLAFKFVCSVGAYYITILKSKSVTIYRYNLF